MSKPIPTLAVLDKANQRFAHAEFAGKVSLQHGAGHRSNLDDIGSNELGLPISRASIASTVGQFVSLVAGSRFPRKMAFRAAPFMALATRMCGLVLGRWCWAVGMFADKAMDMSRATTNDKFTVPGRDSSVRPYETFLPSIGQDNAFEEGHWFTSDCTPTERVAVQSEASVVRATKAPRHEALAAIRNRAYAWVSHFSLQKGWFGQGWSGASNHQISPSFVSWCAP